MAMINKHGTFSLVELHNQVSSATFDTTYIPILHNCNIFPDQQQTRYTRRHKWEQEDKKKKGQAQVMGSNDPSQL
jgi:hypothetical protein